MTQRERILSILVGGLLVAVLFRWGFDKYRTAVRKRDNEIARLQNDTQQRIEQRLQGEYANRQMGEYLVRSLPGNPEQAQSDYQQWLLGMVQDNNLSGAVVDSTSSRAIGGLYQKLDYRVNGTTTIQSFLGLLHAFYAKDYLHRVRDMSLTPNKGNDFTVAMTIESIALLSAPKDLPAREATSWRVDGDLASYRDPILNRNLFEPPNQSPKYKGNTVREAIVGRDSAVPLSFEDPENQDLRYELAGETPQGVRLDERSGKLSIMSDKLGEIQLLVRAIDNGYPPRSTEQKLTVRVVDPPPPTQPPAPKLKFDDSTQTFLTALVQGRDEWTAWMHVRTRDQTLRLRVDDKFEIGSLKGSVIEVTPRFATLEVDGRRFTLEPAGNLNEAAKRSLED